MPETADPPTAHRLGDAAVVSLVTAFFGALWGLTGAFALPGAYSPLAALVVIVATAALLVARGVPKKGYPRTAPEPAFSSAPEPREVPCQKTGVLC